MKDVHMSEIIDVYEQKLSALAVRKPKEKNLSFFLLMCYQKKLFIIIISDKYNY